jgi:hypothetical protein
VVVDHLSFRDKGDDAHAFAVIVVNDMKIPILAAIGGVGLAFSFEEYVARHLASGALVRVLEDWWPPFAVFFLYYPAGVTSRRRCSALIDALVHIACLVAPPRPRRNRALARSRASIAISQLSIHDTARVCRRLVSICRDTRTTH